MRTWQSMLPLLVLAAPGLVNAQKPGVDLDQLIKLAKTRAQAVRTDLESKLGPHLEVFKRKYKTEWTEIENHIDEVIKLGDSVVPLLVEKLEPSSASPANLNLASNCARALHKLEPGSFIDSLIDIIERENYHGVGHAIPLLGATKIPRAGDVLTKLLDGKDGHRMLVIAALTKLNHKAAALKIAKMLPIANQSEDRLVVNYLTRTAVPVTLAEVFRALAQVKRGSQILRYISIVRACAVRDAASAHFRLKYFDNQKLDRAELEELADTIAVVAPAGDPKTIKRLKAIIQGGDTTGLGLRTAVALSKLGDRSGPSLLKKNLIKKTRGKNRRFYLNHAHLAEYYLEFGKYESAVSAFEQAIKYATGESLRSMLYLQIARAQAKRKKWSFVRDAMRASAASYERLIQEAKTHPELQEAMKQPQVQKYLAAFSGRKK